MVLSHVLALWILSVVADDDEWDTAANQLVTRRVLEVTAVGEIPVVTSRARKLCEKLVDQVTLNREPLRPVDV